MAWTYHNKPPMGWPLDLSEPINDGLVGYWYMPEGSGITIQDLSGNRNTGTLTSGVVWSPGKFGRALELDGSDGKIDVSDNPSIQNIFVGGGTILIWIYPRSDGEGNFGRILDKSAENTGGWFFIVNSESGGFVKMRFGKYSSGDNGAWETTNAVIPINAWSCVAVTFNEDNIDNLPLLYVNAKLEPQTQTANPTATYISDVGMDLIIGNNIAAPSNRTFDGLVDVPSLYNRILSPFEIALLCRFSFYGFLNPDEIPVLDQYYTVAAGTILPQITNAYMEVSV